MADWKLYISANGATRTLVHPSAIVGVEETPDGNVRLLLAGGGQVPVRSSFLTIAQDLSDPPPAPAITNVIHQDVANPQPIVHGTAEPHAVIKLFDGLVMVGTVTADNHGAWQIATNPLSVGMHDLTATQTDQLGLVSELSNAAQVEIVAPTPPPAPVIPAPEIPPAPAAPSDAAAAGQAPATAPPLPSEPAAASEPAPETPAA